MNETGQNLKCCSESKPHIGIYIARCIYLGSVRPALTYCAASFRRFSRGLKYLSTTLSHHPDGFEMVVDSGSLANLS